MREKARALGVNGARFDTIKPPSCRDFLRTPVITTHSRTMAARFISKLSYVVCTSLILLCSVETAPSDGSGSGSAEDYTSELTEVNQTEYCPGYRAGNPNLASDLDECKSGAEIGVLDHIHAFGMDSLVRSPNWSACGIPTLPGEK